MRQQAKTIKSKKSKKRVAFKVVGVIIILAIISVVDYIGVASGGLPGQSDACATGGEADIIASGADRCRTPAAGNDSDLDGVGDLSDNCLYIPNPEQLDTNQDTDGDACEGNRNDCSKWPIPLHRLNAVNYFVCE